MPHSQYPEHHLKPKHCWKFSEVKGAHGEGADRRDVIPDACYLLEARRTAADKAARQPQASSLTSRDKA